MKVRLIQGHEHSQSAVAPPALEDVLRRIPGLVVQEVSRVRGLLLFFKIEDLAWLYPIGRATSHNYGGWGFRVELSTSDVEDEPVSFCICGVAAAEKDVRRPPRATKRNAEGELALRLNAVLDSAEVLRVFRLDARRVLPLERKAGSLL